MSANILAANIEIPKIKPRSKNTISLKGTIFMLDRTIFKTIKIIVINTIITITIADFQFLTAP